jgi:hypothetical protein
MRTTASFPLRLKRGERYLVDSRGQPFLIHGDAAWSLLVQLKRDEVDDYLEDRVARGFNALLVNLIEHMFADHPPHNAYGHRPFRSPGDFGTPDEQYFAHVDWVIGRAEQKGLLVLLVPAYLGYQGDEEGWYTELLANGSDRLRAYGRYLGKRYRKFSNILWVYGGDYSPPDRNVVQAIAEGIREFDHVALGSAHCSPETSAIEYWGAQEWLQVNSAYTYQPVYLAALREYSVAPIPFFLLESTYENERDITTRQLRIHAYHALLSGAAGHVFGNNPIWHFDGPGIFPTSLTWRQALDGSGSRSMTHVWNLFAQRHWWTLEPDIDNTILTDGLGTGHGRAVAARSNDRSFAIVYIPAPPTVQIDLGQLAGPRIAARWYDPTNGNYSSATGFLTPAVGRRSFRPPGLNYSRDLDWVLVLDSAP